jgi:hypothetical protein
LNYYRRDGISRPSPNRKDVVLINGTSVSKRFMEMTISQAFRFFSMDHPSLKIKKSKFSSLRPKDVKPESPHDVCLCIYHENMSLLLKVRVVLSDQSEFYFSFKAWNSKIHSNITLDDLIESVVCDSESEECCSHACSDCSSNIPSSVLLEAGDIDEEEEVTWTIWKSIDKKVMLQTVSGPITSLLWEIDERWGVFLLHAFVNRQQRKYIEMIREQSSDDECIIAQIDYAENYKFVRQREPQSAHWNTDQATLFTVHLKIGKEHRCMALISDYMTHDSKFVWLAQDTIVNFVKEQYPHVKKINYLRYVHIIIS